MAGGMTRGRLFFGSIVFVAALAVLGWTGATRLKPYLIQAGLLRAPASDWSQPIDP